MEFLNSVHQEFNRKRSNKLFLPSLSLSFPPFLPPSPFSFFCLSACVPKYVIHIHVYQRSIPSVLFSTLFILKQGVSVNLDFTDWIGWLASESLGSLHLFLAALGFQTSATLTSHLHRCLGSEPSSLFVQQELSPLT